LRTNWKSIVGAFLTLGVLYLVGVLLLLDPIAATDAPTGPLVPLPVGFGIAIAVYIALFVWIEKLIGDPYKAAMALALSQLTLVNIDFVLSGKRGIATAAASTVLLLASWSATAWVYSRLKTRSSPQ
jgi:hypothetical protein